MSRLNRWLLIPLLLAFLAGCMPNSIVSPSKKSFQSEKPRVAAPGVSTGERSALAEGNTAFALDLYHALGKPDNNFFYSPFSISLALAMTYAGARGDMAAQMANTLHFTLPPQTLHPAFNALDQELAQRKDLKDGSSGQGADGKGFRLNVVNDIWGQQDADFQAEFLDLLASNYGAGLRGMDFKSDPNGARKTINDYIAQKTEDRIKDLIPAGSIDALTRLVLTNAIYFNAAWLNPFDKNQTKAVPFTHLDGSKTDVQMMALSGEIMPYADGDGYQAVALPYENQQLSMLILVPDEGNFQAFEAGLTADRLAGITASMQSAAVNLKMPKFTLESEFSLKDTLPGMGMTDAFSPNNADFSGMDGKRDLYISDVIHKSFVKVDEAGTEAAAATAVLMKTTAALADPLNLTIDRPFIFIIRDEPTNTILFIGRILAP